MICFKCGNKFHKLIDRTVHCCVICGEIKIPVIRPFFDKDIFVHPKAGPKPIQEKKEVKPESTRVTAKMVSETVMDEQYDKINEYRNIGLSWTKIGALLKISMCAESIRNAFNLCKERREACIP